ADLKAISTADEEAMDRWRKDHPLPLPAPFKSREQFRDAVRRAVYGDGPVQRPVCHRPVKRKLIGALHEETLFGPALDPQGRLTENYTAKKSVLQLDPNHLRRPRPEPYKDALQRLTEHFKAHGFTAKQAKERAEQVLKDANYKPRTVDPSPGKSGIVR